MIARADDADPAAVTAAAEAIRRPDRPVFVVAAGHDDRGLGEWIAWLQRSIATPSPQAPPRPVARPRPAVPPPPPAKRDEGTRVPAFDHTGAFSHCGGRAW